MAKIIKEFDLYAWRHNNINIVAVSKEHNGKELVFNLYTDSIQNKALNSTSKDYIPHLYVELPNSKSAYVVGVLDKINSKVSFKLESCLLPFCGRFNCFVSLVCEDTIIKFAGIALCVLNGDINDYVDNISKTDSYDVLVSNVNYLMSKIDNVVSDYNIKNIEMLSTYPNVSNNCLIAPCEYKSTTSWEVNNGGNLGTKDLCLTIKNSQTTDLLGTLIKEKEVNKTSIMLVKIRMKMIEGQYTCVYPIYSTTTGIVNITSNNIIASNLRPTSGDYLLTDNEWHNIWFIFDCDIASKITKLGIRLATSSNVIISNINAFYSLDKNGSGGATFVDSGITSNSTTYYTAITNSSLEITPTTFEEGEI